MFLFLPISLLPGVKEDTGCCSLVELTLGGKHTYVKHSTSLTDWLEVIWTVGNWNVAGLEPIILSYP